jgi:hypothetical protein
MIFENNKNNKHMICCNIFGLLLTDAYIRLKAIQKHDF